ncbi:hypothetical protein F8M41_016381 [Gigaspora margarita]|uniref:Uncharacterized protein n=1 Tax=Gigaspora margarita TaxID=4874 RepID=A0A8H4APK0_GIGMA|nr:hypothetical protein F8M41_016381 [Gigaspora margarita]
MTSYITPSIPSQLFPNVYSILQKGKSHEDKVSILYVPSFLDVAEFWNSALTELPVQTVAKAIGRKQSIKGTLLGPACKCVESVNYDDLNDSNHLIKIFKEWTHTHEERSQHHTIVMYNHATKYDKIGKQNVEQDHIMEDDQIMDAEYDQIIDNDEDSEILEDEVVENDQIAEITPLDIQDPFRHIGKGHPSKR